MQNTAVPISSALTTIHSTSLVSRIQVILTSTWLPWIVILGGTGLRLREYLFNRALWFDEAALALNILNRSYTGLLKPLDIHQAAPPLYLLLEKVCLNLFGRNELTLRLVPFLSGIAALYVMYRVARRFLPPAATLLVLLFMALSTQLIIYSSELKPYSSDVLVALLIIWFSLEVLDNPSSLSRLVIFGVIGGLAVWSSYPAMFILAGTGIALLLDRIRKREFRRSAWLLLPGSVWVVAFIGLYLIQVQVTSVDPALQAYWDTQFVQLPMNLVNIKTDITLVTNLFLDPIRLGSPALAFFALVAGLLVMLTKHRTVFFMLAIPFIFLVATSLVHYYPLGARLILFSLPVIYLLIAQGATHIRVAPDNSSWWLSFVLACLLLSQPLLEARRLAIHPTTKEEIKQPLAYIQKNWQPGDKIFVYDGARLAFQYYAPLYGFSESDFLIAIGRQPTLEKYTKDLQRLHGMQRVWILFSHVWTTQGVNEQDYYLSVLDGMGKRLQGIQAPGAAAFLYELHLPPI